MKRNEILNIQIAQSPAGIAGSRMRPRSEQRLHGCAELRKFEWFLDELNRVWSAAFRIQLRNNTGRDCEKTRVGTSGADAFEKFNRVRLRRIEIDDEQNRTRFDDARLRLGKRVDGEHAMTRRKFLQRRRNSGGERIVFFDEKNARRCPGWRFLRSRHGGSKRKGRE